jgi:hypothetical protein
VYYINIIMDSIDILILLLSTISFVCSVLLILVHFLMPKTRKHPGQFILIQALFQAYLDLYYMTIPNYFNPIKTDTGCYIFGLIFTQALIQANYFFVIFAIEIYIEMKKKFTTTHLNRCRVYYIISFVIFVVSLVAGILTDGYGKKNEFSCFVKKSSVFGDVVIFSLLLMDGILLIVLFLSFRVNTTRSKIIKKHLAMVCLSEILIITSYFVDLAYSNFQYNNNDKIALVFLTPLGFIISIFRLSNKKLLREIKWKLFHKSRRLSQLNREKSCLLTFNDEVSTINEFFEVNSIKVLFI